MSLEHPQSVLEEIKAARRSLHVHVDGNFLVIPCPPTTYEVELERLQTPESILGFIAHMAEKNWITPRLIWEIIVILERHTELDLRRGW